MNANCRIGTIRFKNGATVRVFPDRRLEESAWISSELRKAVSGSLDAHEGKVAGFALVVWDTECSHSSAVQCGNGSMIAGTQVPSFAEDVLRRRLWRRDARDEISKAFGWDDG